MLCKKCKKEIDDDSTYCKHCGAKQIREPKARRRSNGEGSIVKTYNGKWRLYVTTFVNGERKVKTKTFKTRAEAIAYVPILKAAEDKKPKTLTLIEAYNAFIDTHKVSDATITNYRNAVAYFKELHNTPLADIDVDDLQACIDECPKGRRTKENMKVIAGLIYKYAIPRYSTLRPLNLAQYLKIYDTSKSAERLSFTASQLEQIRQAIGVVPYADYIYCHCYLGFRPSALLNLRVADYVPAERAFVGGIKTEAGKNRTVTISPKIQPYIENLLKDREYVFCDFDGGKMPEYIYRGYFYSALEAIGIPNPVDENGLHKYTPHSCRHTFATLLKSAVGSDTDKLSLIGHTRAEQLREYQGVDYESLRSITDQL